MLSDVTLQRQQRNSLSYKVTRAFSQFKEGTTLKEALSKLSTTNYVTIIFLQIIVFVALCTAYLAFSNKYITQGYIVNRLEATRSDLILQNEAANRLIEESKSLSLIREDAHTKMVYSGNHTYIETHDTQVAQAY